MPFLYEEIKQSILELAARSEPHSRLPSRKALCARYQVARTTVDRAVNELMAEGYLYSANGSGTYIADHATNGLALPNEGMNVAVLLPNIMHDTYPGILRGIEDVMQVSGVNVALCNTDNDFDKQESYIQRLVRSKVSGIIIIPAIGADRESDRLSGLLSKPELPVVFCNRGLFGCPKPLVSSNDFYGGYIATRHLLSGGRRRIAYLASQFYESSASRYLGYQAALEEAGVAAEESLVLFQNVPGSPEAGFSGMTQLMDRRPDAVFCFNDQLARGAMDAIKHAGRSCGDDIALVGYDDTPLCEAVRPRLTSVAYREYENGQIAARMLLQMILHPGRPQPRITATLPTLTVRESSPRKT